MMFLRPLLTAALACSLWAADASASEFGRFGEMVRDPHQMSKRSPPVSKLETRSQKDFRFLNKQTKPYLVDHLPDVPYDVGEMYSGLVPIEMKDKSRQLFFVFQPTTGKPVDEITIFLNGGPGCSSLESFFQETGRFTWKKGTFRPVENPYTWVNLTNMLWVDQPVGTGFSIGKPTATTQEETAADFVKFFKNFQQLFGIKKFKIYVTGESYAGRYVPYISAAFLDQKDKDYYDLHGALVYDPCIGQFDYVQEEVPTWPFVQQHLDIFNFNDSFTKQLEEAHKKCGYQEFIDKYLTFPASGVQPPKFFNYTSEADCDLFDLVLQEAMHNNPCFDVYRITDTCPLPYDPLGFPTSLVYEPAGATVYFDRPDVKKAIHAPMQVTWSLCSTHPVFMGGSSGPEQEGDTSANPIEHVLPQVIEGTNRVLVSNADHDMIILTNGTLMAIQNMTWNGKLGFQSRPSTPVEIMIPDLEYGYVFQANNQTEEAGQGIMGIQHYERGLMWVETYQSGHMQPENQGRSTYRHLEWLLGHTDHI